MEQLHRIDADAQAVSRRRILVCDDEREIADMVARLMEREGFSCTVCYDSLSALDAMRHNAADLAILDIMMSGMDGYELARRIREFSNAPLALTPKEFALLQALMEAGGSPRSAAELFERVWGQRPDAAASNTVMVHVRHLRKKLAAIDASAEFVVTVWGVGYRMNAG